LKEVRKEGEMPGSQKEKGFARGAVGRKDGREEGGDGKTRDWGWTGEGEGERSKTAIKGGRLQKKNVSREKKNWPRGKPGKHMWLE